MESPHEHQQNLLLSRIITNVEKLNEAIVIMNRTLQEINIQNMNIELVAQMFKNYQSTSSSILKQRVIYRSRVETMVVGQESCILLVSIS